MKALRRSSVVSSIRSPFVNFVSLAPNPIYRMHVFAVAAA